MSSVCPICRYPRKLKDRICSQCGATLPVNPPNNHSNIGDDWLDDDSDERNANRLRISGRSDKHASNSNQTDMGNHDSSNPIIVGRITKVIPQQEENPDVDPWMVLSWILLAFDLIYLFYRMLFFGVMVLVILGIITILLSRGRNLIPNGCFSVLFFLPNIFRGRQNIQRIPVNTYTVRPDHPNSLKTFRVKGQLNQPPTEGDRVRIWGSIDQGVVRFRRGENISDELYPIQLSLRNRSYGWVWFIGLAIANIVYFLSAFAS